MSTSTAGAPVAHPMTLEEIVDHVIKTYPEPGDKENHTVTETSKTVDSEHAVIPSMSALSNGDTKRDTIGTLSKDEKRPSLSMCIVLALKAEPDHTFDVLDVVERTGGKKDTVKRLLPRLASSGKGSGAVKRVSPGFYHYDPLKEQDSLMNLVQSGCVKFENIVFTKIVHLKTHSGVVSLSNTIPESAKETPSDKRIPKPKPGYPWKLPTGQCVAWLQYYNGSEMIRLSADGHPPFSPDHLLTLIAFLRRDGLVDKEWQCTSLEANLDSPIPRIDASYSMEIVTGLFLKIYQHGYNARVEIADRRKVPVREVLELLHGVVDQIDGREALKKVAALEKQFAALCKLAQKDHNLAQNRADTLINHIAGTASHSSEKTRTKRRI